jgi:hypothetical protein
MHAPRQHRQDYMEQEARTVIQTMNRQDLEAGIGFTVYFRAQPRTGSYGEIGILVLHGSSGSNGSEARKAFNPIQRNAGLPWASCIIGVVLRPYRCFSSPLGSTCGSAEGIPLEVFCSP